jgi:RimJ/RimL family protein N-acetyltransferase
VLPVESIRTARLDLVPLRPDEADEMAGVLADPGLYAFTGGEPPDSDMLRERYQRQVVGQSADGSEQWLNWIARLRESGQAIGYVQATIRPAANEADVAWLISVASQGRGLASEAAAALVDWLIAGGVRTIEAHIHPEHAASAAVARRAGLTATDTFDADGEQVWRRRVR